MAPAHQQPAVHWAVGDGRHWWPRRDESRAQGLDRLELIRFLQVAQTISVHHGALAYLLGINAFARVRTVAVRIKDYQHTLRGHRVLQLVGKGSKPATMALTVPVLRGLTPAAATAPKAH